MDFLPAVGGLGIATIAGSYFNKLTPAAIVWQPQGTRAPTETSLVSMAKNSAGTLPIGINDVVDKIRSPLGEDNPKYSTAKSLVFQCVASEAFSVASSVTKFPVDSGFSVSDHTIRQNPTIQIEGVISNTPMSKTDLTSLSGIMQIGGAILGKPLGGVLGSAINLGKALFGGNQKSDIENFHTTIEGLVTSGQLVRVSTLRGMYDNCVITSYSTRADVDSSTCLKFTLTLEKLYVIDMAGNPVNQTNQALTTVSATVGEKVRGYANAIGISAIGVARGLL